jgi:transcriptional regulator with XRE-family HTH domain
MPTTSPERDVMDFLTIEEQLRLLGEYVRGHRLAMNISQQELAKRSGISLKAVRNVESGSNSTLESCVAVCRSLRKTDWIASLTPPEMSRDDFERYMRGTETKRKRASRHV